MNQWVKDDWDAAVFPMVDGCHMGPCPKQPAAPAGNSGGGTNGCSREKAIQKKRAALAAPCGYQGYSASAEEKDWVYNTLPAPSL